MAKGLAGLVKSIKKKVTLKGVVRTAVGLAGAIPVVGGAISTAANVFAAAKGQASAAASAAQDTAMQQLNQAAAGGGTFQTNPGGPQPLGGLDMKNPLVWVGLGVVALLLFRRR